MLFVLLQYMDSDYLPLVIMLFVLLQYMDSDYLPLVIMLFVLLHYMDSDYLPLVSLSSSFSTDLFYICRNWVLLEQPDDPYVYLIKVLYKKSGLEIPAVSYM
jgi:hypothetical protein